MRSFLDHVNAEEIEAALTHVAPEAVLDWSDSPAPDRGLYHGPQGWGSWMAGRSESLAEARFEVQELIEVRPDTFVLVAYMSGRGRASGLEIAALGAGVCTLSDGRLTRLTLYQSREEALRASSRLCSAQTSLPKMKSPTPNPPSLRFWKPNDAVIVAFLGHSSEENSFTSFTFDLVNERTTWSHSLPKP